jgi:hypothetical protein
MIKREFKIISFFKKENTFLFFYYIKMNLKFI